MAEWSDFHRRRRPEPKDFGLVSPETIRREFTYRDFLLQRTDPDHGHMWTISDLKGTAVAGLGGAFTKLQLAQDAVDRHIEDEQEEEKSLH